ncbi:MAG: DUF1501 domain-containing protein [Verrucomicrobiales bacterium]|nr:DUF1501 domain-containing protein [Verrucomicrobiales bacterium]
MNDILDLAGRSSHSRRNFMQRTAQVSLGVGMSSLTGLLPSATRAQSGKGAGGGKAKSVIYIYLAGGMSHLDTFDPKDSKKVMGPSEAISTNVDGLRLGNHFKGLAKHADKIALINSMMSTNGAHEVATYMNLTGYSKRATIVHPTIGPFAEELLGKRGKILPDSVVVGPSTSNSGYLDPSRSPLPIADPAGGVPNTQIQTDETRFDRRMEIAQRLGKRFTDKYKYASSQSYVEYYKQANQLLKSDELEAFDISQETNAAKYGSSRLGQGCLLAKRLVEHGVRVVEVRVGGWDMHVGLENGLASKVPDLDRALTALIEELSSLGLLDSTLIAVNTDFGRTPAINMNAGRDHFPAAYSTMLAGGGIVGGQVYGATDKLGKKVKAKPVDPTDFVATMGYAMGVDLDEVIYSPTRRPFTFANKGKPLTSLFG